MRLKMILTCILFYSTGSLFAQEEVWLSYVYSYGDIAIFSYENSSEFEIKEQDGTPVFSTILMIEEHEQITDLEPGVYKVTCNNRFSVLSGDPWSTGLGVWAAVDEYSKPLSTKLLSVGPKCLQAAGNYAEAAIAVFAYQDNTHVLLEDMDANVSVWEGDLDSAEYYLYRHDDPDNPEGFPYSVEASKPICALTLNGMGGMYVPDFNGTFTGRDFMTYIPYCYQNRDLDKDIAVLPWFDSTHVTVADLHNPYDIVWDHLCLEKGIIQGTRIPLPYAEDHVGRAIYIHSDKDISVSHTPYASYGSSTIGFFLMRGMDYSGLGLGNEFHLPLVCSGGEDHPSRLHVIAYLNNTDINITRTQKYTGIEDFIWQGTLNAGEDYRFTSETWDAAATATYHVIADKTVGTLINCYDDNGADFFPIINAEALAVSEPEPETHPKIRVTSAVGPQIVLRYENMPRGFFARVFDASGRWVDELHSSDESGTLTWGCGQPEGVYFIKPEQGSGSPMKVVLLK
ncbi:hypothetical protein JXM67_02965 [candidate division WOR-3 bacterium]|nr:hypothetical protein [candidate division WOR-3 bacterium]